LDPSEIKIQFHGVNSIEIEGAILLRGRLQLNKAKFHGAGRNKTRKRNIQSLNTGVFKDWAFVV